MSKERIWEIDALRGLCMVAVIAAHLYFDLWTLLGVHWNAPLLEGLFQWGGLIFVVISGMSATLGSRSFRRGLMVLGCGMVITLVTVVMIGLGLMDSSMQIWFGVLHLLGVCMLLYPVLKRLPDWLLTVLGAAIIGVGYWFMSFRIGYDAGFTWKDLLFPLGLMTARFSAGDYFPLLPYLGWFMLGMVLGRWLYGQKRTLFPRVNVQLPPIRFLTWMGRNSLPVYLIHQPIVFGAVWLIGMMIYA